jgi:hypothetical protein
MTKVDTQHLNARAEAKTRSRRSDIHAGPEAAPPTRVDDQVTQETKADTLTPRRNTAEAVPRSRRSGNHASPRAAHRPADNEKLADTNHQSDPLVPPTGGTSKTRPQQESDARASPSPGPSWIWSFPRRNPSGGARNTATMTPPRRTRHPRVSPSSNPAVAKARLSPGRESQTSHPPIESTHSWIDARV